MVFLLGFFLTSFAQRDSGNLVSLKTYKVHTVSVPHTIKNLPFSQIMVLDERFDQSKVGFLGRKTFLQAIPDKSNLQHMSQTYLNRVFKNCYDTSSNQTLLLVIKHLWLQETNKSEANNNKITWSGSDASQPFIQLNFTFELYLQKDSGFLRLFRMDSVIETAKTNYKKCNKVLSLSFIKCMEKVSTFDVARQIQRIKLMSWPEIEGHNSSRMSYPRFNNDTLVRGIYMTFNDFLNNRPSNNDFEIKRGKLTDELYVLNKGETTILQDYWGFCDGRRNYIKLGLNVFELYRNNNVYQCWGSKGVVQRNGKHQFPAIQG